MRFLPDPVAPVAVVGAGPMGASIALQAAIAGHEVRITEPDVEAHERAGRLWARDIRALAALGLLPEGEGPVRSRLALGDDLASAVGSASVVIEAVPEDLDLKRTVFDELHAVAPSDAVLGTTTSALSISEIADGGSAASRVVGCHFVSPDLRMPVAEVMGGAKTDKATRDAAARFVAGLGKEVVALPTETRGYVTVRVAAEMVGAALNRYAGQPPSLDAGFRALGFPMGPFERMDRVGIDVWAAILRGLTGSAPPALAVRAERGDHGVKTKMGFFRYDSNGGRKADHPPPRAADPWPVIAFGVDAAARIVAAGMDPAAIDRAMRLSYGFPLGPLALAQDHGMARIIKAHRTGKGKPSDDLLAAQAAKWYEAVPGPIGVRQKGGVASLRICSTNTDNHLDEDLAKRLEGALAMVADADVVLLSGEGRQFVRDDSPEPPGSLLAALRARPVVALVHGALGPTDLAIMQACRVRLARTDTGLVGADGEPVTSFGLLERGDVDAVAHPSCWVEGVAHVAGKVAGVDEAAVRDVLA